MSTTGNHGSFGASAVATAQTQSASQTRTLPLIFMTVVVYGFQYGQWVHRPSSILRPNVPCCTLAQQHQRPRLSLLQPFGVYMSWMSACRQATAGLVVWKFNPERPYALPL